jgi:DNA-binding transcriptional regulator YiaG
MNRLELKAWRRKRYLSQATLAALLGVSTNTVNRWEAGERDFPKRMLVLALGYLDVLHEFRPDGHYARSGLAEVFA